MTNLKEEERLDRLFEMLRAEYGLISMLHAGSDSAIDDAQIQVLSKVVDGALHVNPGGKGREIAVNNLLSELHEMIHIQTNRHFRYWDPDYPLSNHEMRGLRSYIEKLKNEIATLLPPQPITIPAATRQQHRNRRLLH